MARLKRGAIAFVLSFSVPGLGQIFNGQFRAGVIFFVFYVCWVLSAGMLRALLSFGSAIGYLIVLWILQLAAAIHAARVAVRQANGQIVPKLGWRSYALGAALVFIISLIFVGDDFPGRILGVHAYKIPAESMSPTLIPGDRLIVDMRYYEAHRPERGDIIVFKMPQDDVLYIKRVVAVGGDTIAGDSEKTNLNGKRIPEPYLFPASGRAPGSDFGPVSIPSDELFVMGDNRNESYDSRFFGLVDVNRVIGKALYIYYSPGNLNRIGHTIQ